MQIAKFTKDSNLILRKAVIYENKSGPASRGHSQTTVSEGCKKYLTN